MDGIFILPLGVAAGMAVLSLAALGPDRSIGPDAVWTPGAGFIAEVHKACDQFSAPKLTECFVDTMAKLAPAPAVAFTRSIRNEGWMRGFRETGTVDVAYVEYPFRANQNQGWLFVNGASGAVDPDNIRKLPSRGELPKDKLKATLFPGDRFGDINPVAVIHSDGSQQFVVEYRVTDGCRACEELGRAFFAFNFDAKGKYRGVRFAGYERGTIAARPLEVRVNETFTLSLACDPEFDWGMEQRPSDAILRVTDKVKRPDERAQLWKFAVSGTGTTQMILRYVSAKSPDSTQILALRITSAPALGGE